MTHMTRERHITNYLRRLIRTPLGKLIYWASRLVYPPYQTGWVETSHVDIYLPRLPIEFSGYRLAQISDFHFGTWFTRRHLEDVVELVNREKPDMVALTGDFVTFDPDQYAPVMTSLLGRLVSEDGGLFILGNHDHWTGPETIRSALGRAGLIDLSNRVNTVHRGASRLHFAGIDCVYDGQDRLDLVVDQLPRGEAAVLLVHEPDFADLAAATGSFDFQISGHSHGGQICFPGLGPLYLPRHAKRYPSGSYQVCGMPVYTNRGLGTAELPVRLYCPPEISIFTLHTAEPQDFLKVESQAPPPSCPCSPRGEKEKFGVRDGGRAAISHPKPPTLRKTCAEPDSF